LAVPPKSPAVIAATIYQSVNASTACKECLTPLSEVCKELLTGKGATVENRVREYREAAGWSQGELARRLGVSRQTINAVETDKYDPSLPLALRMAGLFALEVRELFIDHWTAKE
jgi:putative transcriptional regulator